MFLKDKNLDKRIKYLRKILITATGSTAINYVQPMIRHWFADKRIGRIRKIENYLNQNHIDF